jgi:pimeloyl-ACP methyl ester carboxylesterase
LHACAVAWRKSGVTLEAYNSRDNAGDVAQLIEALGAAKARIVGISYGTFLGFALLRDHGALVDRAVFAGTEGPDHTVKLPSQADPVLKGLSARFARRDGGWNLEAAARRVFAKLADAPATVATGDGGKQLVSLYDAQVVTTFLMATSTNAERLPELFKAMDAGDFSGMAKSVLYLRHFYGGLPAMPFAMDAASPTSPEREALARSLVSNSMFGNSVNFPSADLASALGVPQLPPRYHAPLDTEVPALFVSGELDSRTPPANADAVRKGFRTSAHLIVQGGGHDNDLFLATPAILDRIDTFLAGTMPRDEMLPVDWSNAGER